MLVSEEYIIILGGSMYSFTNQAAHNSEPNTCKFFIFLNFCQRHSSKMQKRRYIDNDRMDGYFIDTEQEQYKKYLNTWERSQTNYAVNKGKKNNQNHIDSAQ